MKKLTKIGLLATLLTSLFVFTACSSKNKAEETNAESALVEQTQDLMADNEPVIEDGVNETSDIEESADIANSDSLNDDLANSAPVSDESDLGATSSGLGH
ncbi:MAG: hypothetical protein KDD40_05130 [Bdellovibrionales bacterium]|nr:hypothetical protein [Bdellovibrionales bacterium]